MNTFKMLLPLLTAGLLVTTSTLAADPVPLVTTPESLSVGKGNGPSAAIVPPGYVAKKADSGPSFDLSGLTEGKPEDCSIVMIGEAVEGPHLNSSAYPAFGASVISNSYYHEYPIHEGISTNEHIVIAEEVGYTLNPSLVCQP